MPNNIRSCLFSILPFDCYFCFHYFSPVFSSSVISYFTKHNIDDDTGESETKYGNTRETDIFLFLCRLEPQIVVIALIVRKKKTKAICTQTIWERSKIQNLNEKAVSSRENTTATRHTFDDTEPTAQCLKCAKRQRWCTYATHALQTSGVQRRCMRFRIQSLSRASDRQRYVASVNVMPHVARQYFARSDTHIESLRMMDVRSVGHVEINKLFIEAIQ